MKLITYYINNKIKVIIEYNNNKNLCDNKIDGNKVYIGSIIIYKKVKVKSSSIYCLRKNIEKYKKIDENKIILKFIDNPSIKNELKLLNLLENKKFIIQLFHINYFNNKYNSILYKKCLKQHFIIEEFCEGGDLFNFFMKRQFLTEEEIKIILFQIIIAIREYNSCNIIHTDLKLENIALLKKNDLTNIKIIDFTGSKQVDLQSKNLCNYNMKDFSFSLHYMPPEMFYINNYRLTDLKHIDTWQIGIIGYILLYGTYPYNGKNPKKIYSNIKNNKDIFSTKFTKNRYVSKNLINLIKKLLVIEPDKRLDLNLIDITSSIEKKNIYSDIFIDIKNSINFD